MHLKIEELTTEQKLGMLYCARPFNDRDLEFTLKLIKKRALGSVQVPPKKPHYMKAILEAADYPIITVCDTETGFPTSTKQPIPLVTLSACHKPEFYEVFAKAIAIEAKEAGFNATWGPVVDVISGNGPFRIHRVFSDNVQRTCEAAEVMARVYARNGYMSCGKHYPGGKDNPYDSHMTPSPTYTTEEQIKSRSFIPYKYLHERGLLPSIMTTHAIYANIDPDNCGTMSRKVQSMIREIGWDGVCWSDSLAMMAVLQKYGEENVLGLAIAAGNDIVLPNYRTPAEVSFGHLVKNYEDGMFSDERMDEAVRRVIALQDKLAEIPNAVDVFTEEDQKLYDSIAWECITAVTDEGVSPALDPNKSKLFVVLTDNSFQVDDETLETTTSEWYDPNRVVQRIRELYPDAAIEFLPEYPKQKDNERVLVASTKYDETVFVSFCTTQAYLGTDGLTRRVEAVINALNLSNRLAAVVHFGNPFALEEVLHLPRMIFGYTMPDSQKYAIDVLAGKLPANGTLPFDVHFT